MKFKLVKKIVINMRWLLINLEELVMVGEGNEVKIKDGIEGIEIVKVMVDED